MLFFLMVMGLLFVICEALLKKKTTILLPTIHLHSEIAIRGWKVSDGWWKNMMMIHLI